MSNPNSAPAFAPDGREYWDKLAIAELEGMRQAGIEASELARLVEHPHVAGFVLDKLEDVDTLADPAVQRSLVELRDEPESLIDITPEDS